MNTSPARTRSITTPDLANIAVFAALTCVLSLAPAVPVGPLGVPITLQTLAVFLAAMILGGWRGFLAILLYVVVGLIGVPVLAGFKGGPGVLAGPSAGYLLSFPFAAALVGWLAHKAIRAQRRSRVTSSDGSTRERSGVLTLQLFVASVAGIALTHAMGIAGMMINAGLTLNAALLTDLAFIPGDLLKGVVAALIAVGVHRAFPRMAGAVV